MIKVAVIGFGVVGSGVVDIIHYYIPMRSKSQ